MINPSGFYNDTIVFTRKSTSRTATGQETATWSTQYTVKGKFRPLSGNELLIAQRDGTYSTHRVYCASLAITEQDRVSFGGNIYVITFIKNPMNYSAFLQVDLKILQG